MSLIDDNVNKTLKTNIWTKRLTLCTFKNSCTLINDNYKQ